MTDDAGPLTATIDIPGGQTDAAAFMVVLRITNRADHAVAILNPDLGVPGPAIPWSHSIETYRASLLISFGYLSITVIDEAGGTLPQQSVQTWATPALRRKLELAAGESLGVNVPVGNFYRLVGGKRYLLTMEYGDPISKVRARTHVTVP